MEELNRVALRQQSVFVPQNELTIETENLRQETLMLTANLSKLGFGPSEELLHALNKTSLDFQKNLLFQLKTLMKVNDNWTPLVKNWKEPTGESWVDHLVTYFYEIMDCEDGSGTQLQCGHLIPDNTFPLERYNGCPYCGTPFESGSIENYGQASSLKILDLWTEYHSENHLKDLLLSKTALDATQMDSLKLLLSILPFPEMVTVTIRETTMLVIDTLIDLGREKEVQKLFKSPTDILRYLWYKKTGFWQIYKPRNIVKRKKVNAKEFFIGPYEASNMKEKLQEVRADTVKELKLKYNRRECRRAASWLNNMNMRTEKMCELMHPQRDMWVRFIRALRLPEYAKKEGYEHLKEMLHLFYTESYTVWAGELQRARLANDVEKTVALLKKRPGVFARSLFADMLRFGHGPVVSGFADIIDKVPSRLLFTLNMYADIYFKALSGFLGESSKYQKSIEYL